MMCTPVYFCILKRQVLRNPAATYVQKELAATAEDRALITSSRYEMSTM